MALFTAILWAAPAWGQYGANFIDQEVVLVSVDHENRVIHVRDPSTGREYSARLEEKTRLKARKKLIGGKKKPDLQDFAAGDRVRIKVYLGGQRQELREVRLLRKAASKT